MSLLITDHFNDDYDDHGSNDHCQVMNYWKSLFLELISLMNLMIMMILMMISKIMTLMT